MHATAVVASRAAAARALRPAESVLPSPAVQRLALVPSFRGTMAPTAPAPDSGGFNPKWIRHILLRVPYVRSGASARLLCSSGLQSRPFLSPVQRLRDWLRATYRPSDVRFPATTGSRWVPTTSARRASRPRLRATCRKLQVLGRRRIRRRITAAEVRPLLGRPRQAEQPARADGGGNSDDGRRGHVGEGAVGDSGLHFRGDIPPRDPVRCDGSGRTLFARAGRLRPPIDERRIRRRSLRHVRFRCAG